MTILDLDGVEPPRIRERSLAPVVLGVKMPAHLAAWVRERVFTEQTTINAFLLGLVERERDGLPPDCRAWLTAQAAQCGCPGDPDQALVLVLRHLADRWPRGARLRP